MRETAVSDTGPILHLAEIGQLGLLRVFRSVAIPEQAKAELLGSRRFAAAGGSFPEWIEVERVSRADIRRQEALLPACKSHEADLSVAALAGRLRPDVVLTDDLTLRKALAVRGHTIVGSVGVVVRALKSGLIDQPALDKAVNGLLRDSTLFTSSAFRERVHELLRELRE